MSSGGYDEIRAILAQVAALGQSFGGGGDRGGAGGIASGSDGFGDHSYFQAVLKLVLEAMQAPAGIVWTTGEGGRIEAVSQAGLEATGLGGSPEAEQAHNALVPVLLNNPGGIVAPPRAQLTGPDGVVLATNPTDLLVVSVPFDRMAARAGMIEVFQHPTVDQVSPEFLEQIHRGYLVFLEQVAALVTEFLGKRQLAVIDARETAMAQVEQFARRIHESLDPVAAAFVLANEARRIIGCDRVGVLVRRRRQLRLVAVSGQESVEKRASAVQAIEELVGVVAKAGDPLWHPEPGRELPPQIEQELERYIDESHASALAIIPLEKPRPTAVVKPGGNDATAVARAEAAPAEVPEPIGAIVVEWFSASAFDGGKRARVELVADHGKVALANALEHTGLPLYPLINLAGKSRVLTTARNLPRTVLAGLAALAALAALVFVPAELRLEAKGTLEPVRRRDVFARIDGVVEEIGVNPDKPGESLDHGAEVQEGWTLATLRNRELELRIEDLDGRRSSTEEQLAGVRRALLTSGISIDERTRLEGQEKSLEKDAGSLRAQLQLLGEQSKDLEVRSPLTGVLVTWKVKDTLLKKPVQKGQVLMSVADKTGPWELELRLPDDRLGHVNRAWSKAHAAGRGLEVDYVLATDPGTRHRGVVRDIHEQAEVHGEDGNTALVRVEIASERHEEEQLGVGASVTARIACGKRSLGYVWFHDVLAFIQTQVLFRLW